MSSAAKPGAWSCGSRRRGGARVGGPRREELSSLDSVAAADQQPLLPIQPPPPTSELGEIVGEEVLGPRGEADTERRERCIFAFREIGNGQWDG